MAFIDTSETLVGVEIAQIDARYIKPGRLVEITFKFLPAKIYTGRVETVLQAVSTGQVKPSGLAVTPSGVVTAPFGIRVTLDDHESCPTIASWRDQRCGDLHRARQGGPCGPPRHAAHGCDPQLHQSVMMVLTSALGQRADALRPIGARPL